MTYYRPRHARRSPWRWLVTFPPAAGLALACALAASPAVASVSAPRPLDRGVLMQATAMSQVRQAEGAVQAVVMVRRETAADHRQEARADTRQEARKDAAQAAAIAAQQPAQQAAQAAQQASASAPPSVPQQAPVSSGILSFGQLEALWVSAGGPASQESTAASVAECESGGNPNAYNPSGASGLWQILGQVVGGNIFDPMVNALNAVAKYNAAGGWSPWVC